MRLGQWIIFACMLCFCLGVISDRLVDNYFPVVAEGLTAADMVEPQITASGPVLTCSDGSQMQCLDNAWSFDPNHTKIKPKPFAMAQMIKNTERAKSDQCQEMQNAMDVWKAAGCVP